MGFLNDPVTRISPDNIIVSSLGGDIVLRFNNLIHDDLEIVLSPAQFGELIEKQGMFLRIKGIPADRIVMLGESREQN